METLRIFYRYHWSDSNSNSSGRLQRLIVLLFAFLTDETGFTKYLSELISYRNTCTRPLHIPRGVFSFLSFRDIDLSLASSFEELGLLLFFFSLFVPFILFFFLSLIHLCFFSEAKHFWVDHAFVRVPSRSKTRATIFVKAELSDSVDRYILADGINLNHWLMCNALLFSVFFFSLVKLYFFFFASIFFVGDVSETFLVSVC